MSRDLQGEFTDTVYTDNFAAWWARIANIEGVNVVGDKPISIREAIETYLPWQPVKTRNYYYPPPAFAPVMPTDSWTVYRSDTGAILTGRVGSRYEIFDHKQMADLMEDSIGGYPHRCRSVGAIWGGRRVFASLTLDDLPEFDIHGQKLLPIFSSITSHDGTSSVENHASVIVPQCGNTCDMVIRSGVKLGSIRHTTNMQTAIDRVKQNVAHYYSIASDFQRLVREMIETEITNQEFDRIVDFIYPKLVVSDEITERVSRNREEIRESIHATRHSDRVLAPDTAWGAWMAVSTVEQDKTRDSERHLATTFDGKVLAADSRTVEAIKQVVMA